MLNVVHLFSLQIIAPSWEKSLFALFFGPFNDVCRLWHESFSHPKQKLLFMLNSGLLLNKSSPSFQDVSFYCSSAKMGKSKALPFPIYYDITTECLDLVHIDIWGNASTISHFSVSIFNIY